MEHAGGEVLDHAVLHDLHAGGAVAPAARPLARVDQLIDLLQITRAVPPQRAHHARGERTARGQRRIDVAGVGEGGIAVADDRVLPRGDAERVQVLLRQQDAALDVGGHVGRDVSLDERHRSFLQRALRLARCVPLDPPVDGVGRRSVDAREAQRGAVHPRRMAVPVRQEHRPIRHHGVEHGAVGYAAGEDVHGPSAAQDPRLVGMRVGVCADQLDVAVRRMDLAEVAPQAVETAATRVDVRVLEPRQQRASGQVDRLGRRSADLADPIVRADGHDPAASNGHRLRLGVGRVDRVHRAVHERQVGGSPRLHRGSLPAGHSRVTPSLAPRRTGEA